MTILVNKKGTKGFTVGNWNHHGTCFDPGSPHTGEFKKSIQYAIRHVEVHSCGKKLMRLFDLDASGMRRMEFKPDALIFDTAEAAEQHALKLYTEAAPMFAAHQRGQSKRIAEEYAAMKWCAGRVAFHNEAAERLANGGFPLEIVYPSR